MRARVEYEGGHFEASAQHCVGEIEAAVASLAARRSVVTFCNSGRWALAAAAALLRLAREDVTVCWWLMKA